MKLVVAGGGTAGHVNPAISLGRAMSGHELIYLGTAAGAEAALVPAAGFRLETIEVRGFDRSRPFSLPGTGARALGAISDARRLLRVLRPEAVLGMGGYVSLPACVAARTLRIPIVLHEQNIVFGLANRVCRRLARRVAVSFEETLELAGRKGVYVGNPVSPEIVSFGRDAERRRGLERFELEEDRKTLLVFGGSQGAQRVNEAAAALASAWRDRSDVQIVHIVGRKQAPREHDSGGALIYRQTTYVERMIEAYAVADLAVCRGGATTLAEITVVGLPAIIVPYPYHRDRQQELQGRVLERAGAGTVLPDRETTADRLAAEIERVWSDEGRLTAMTIASKNLGRPDAAERLAAVIEEVAA
ncbi:MAG: undecaprenyldiphospho-muramoylpentapeptide beta-N-acetylglucosaminyltransferase [Actinomycetota bacterium]